jgi:hypothetical protein
MRIPPAYVLPEDRARAMGAVTVRVDVGISGEVLLRDRHALEGRMALVGIRVDVDARVQHRDDNALSRKGRLLRADGLDAPRDMRVGRDSQIPEASGISESRPTLVEAQRRTGLGG